MKDDIGLMKVITEKKERLERIISRISISEFPEPLVYGGVTMSNIRNRFENLGIKANYGNLNAFYTRDNSTLNSMFRWASDRAPQLLTISDEPDKKNSRIGKYLIVDYLLELDRKATSGREIGKEKESINTLFSALVEYYNKAEETEKDLAKTLKFGYPSESIYALDPAIGSQFENIFRAIGDYSSTSSFSRTYELGPVNMDIDKNHIELTIGEEFVLSSVRVSNDSVSGPKVSYKWLKETPGHILSLASRILPTEDTPLRTVYEEASGLIAQSFNHLKESGLAIVKESTSRMGNLITV